jgi:hypothetical protein
MTEFAVVDEVDAGLALPRDDVGDGRELSKGTGQGDGGRGES